MTRETNTRICVPVCVAQAGNLQESINDAAQSADIIELRLDCLDKEQLDAALTEIAAVLQTSGKEALITFRPAEQGSKRALDKSERVRFWTEVLPRYYLDQQHAPPAFVDLELDLLESSEKAKLIDALSASRVIGSFHDFTGVPANIEEIYRRIANTSAHIIKIAVQANDITDCIPVFRLLKRARQQGREMIAIAMGPAGIITRVLAPSRGAFLTFGSLNENQATAPGQVSAAELRDLYRIASINDETLVTGLVGSPVMHSVSPHVHNAAFAAYEMNAVYMPFEVRAINEFVRRMVRPLSREMEWNLRGFSVTAPHKTAIMEHLDWTHESAKEIGAVNTVVINDGELYGYNTDAVGAIAPLRNLLKLQGARVAIIGAGGVARAVLWSLREAGAKTTIFARNTERAVGLAKTFDASHAELDGARFEGFDLVINGTPLGTHGPTENETPATAGSLHGARLAYDLVYNPSTTRFMREAQEAGCQTIGGLPMLISQAAEQFKLWTNHEAPFDVMREAGEKGLENRG